MRVYVLLGLLLFAGSTHAKVFQFIYIEPSEGNASGGHVALQLEDKVYHFQYENGLIRLTKNNADDFRVNYQFKQNRSLHVAEVEVPKLTYDRLSNHFEMQYLGQQQKLKHIQALQYDQTLLQSLLHLKTGNPVSFTELEAAVPLPGAGLFYSDGDLGLSKKTNAGCDVVGASAKIIAEVRVQLETRYAKDFLDQKLGAITKEIAQLSPLTDTATYSFSEHYSDLLNGLLALRILQRFQPLNDRACFQLKLPQMRLTETELSRAEQFRHNLLQSVQSLVVSSRPDWGYALFLMLARLIVIEQSLQTQQWTFLDDSDENTLPVSGEQISLYTDNLKKQRFDALTHLENAASTFGSTPNNYERHYAVLEIAANRFQQWFNSDRTGELRYQSEQTLPKKSIPASRFLMTDLSIEQLEQALRHQKMAFQQLSQEDNDRNRYYLLTKNCVTELLGHINAAFSGQSNELVTSVIDPMLNFIPFQAFDAVEDTYNIVKSEELPAYRIQALAKMYDREVNSLVYLRESNVFSSTVYNHNPDDSWFVFFTDDIILFRPIFGVVNTLAATGQSIWGLLRWPFDGGRDIKVGARGILTSLPELAFFNIRKGSYPYPIEP